MAKVVLKIFVLIAILFVVLYVGMENPKPIDFYFPIPNVNGSAPLKLSAAFLYFGFFAVGMLAGALLVAGGGKGGGGKKSAPSKEK